jgi:DNA-3-methyladenine glycosylase II
MAPLPSDLAGLEPERLKRLKFSRQKARALLELSDAVVEGEMNLEGLALLDDEAAVARLLQLWGVGRWTAEYALLRGLGRLHVFPGDDVGARNNLQRWLRLKKPLDYEGVHRTLIRLADRPSLMFLRIAMEEHWKVGQRSSSVYDLSLSGRFIPMEEAGERMGLSREWVNFLVSTGRLRSAASVSEWSN